MTIFFHEWIVRLTPGIISKHEFVYRNRRPAKRREIDAF